MIGANLSTDYCEWSAAGFSLGSWLFLYQGPLRCMIHADWPYDQNSVIDASSDVEGAGHLLFEEEESICDS